MKPSRLLKMMFETERWQDLLDTATEKEISLKVIEELCYPEERKKLYTIIANDKYNVFPPHVQRIPKDKPGEFREVYINEPRDRIILSLINDCLSELFGDMIHPQCRSYQKGTGTQMVVKEISCKICEMKTKTACIGIKADYSKYFDNVKIEVIDGIFDEWERRLGFEKNTEPVINLLRRYYHQDLYFDVDNSLKRRYQGLKQGCAVASILANVCLYKVDEYMSNKYQVYYRYSDDSIVIDEDTSNVVSEMNELIKPYGICLNPYKVERLYKDKWFKFLGFNIKGNQITLSANRVKKFQKEIENRSINKKKKTKKFTGKQAKNEIVKFLYEGKYNWASSCLGTINVESDVQELNKFIMDCIKACDTGKLKIGGLGSVNNLSDKTILRGKGRNVKANRNKVEHIDNYLSMGCLQNGLKICKPVFETQVRSMKG